MASVTSYSAAGVKSAAKANLDKSVFGLEVKSHGLLGHAYQAYLANGRTNLAKTKTRGEVAGSTRKPWKQKGTGRARFGSRYNPIWRGGGITFGPTGGENYSKKLNLKAKRLAVKQALSLAANEGKIKVIDKFDGGDGKTKKTAILLKKIEANGRILLVVETKTDTVIRSTANIANLKAVSAEYLNVYDVLNADSIVVTKKSLDVISDKLDSKKPAAQKAEAK
jgi:large subunit ribosomal protein L4